MHTTVTANTNFRNMGHSNRVRHAALAAAHAELVIIERRNRGLVNHAAFVFAGAAALAAAHFGFLPF